MCVCVYKTIQSKMGGRPKQTSLQRSHTEHTDGQEICEKMCHITNYYLNAKQNNEVSPHTARKAIIKKPTNSKCWRGCAQEGTLSNCWWKCKLIQLLWKAVWRFHKKLKAELPYDLAIPLASKHPGKTLNLKRYMHLNVHSSTIYSTYENNLNAHQQMNG